jgi:dTMP kinase
MTIESWINRREIIMKGLFITFEGPDGSGKTTQIQLLKKHLQKKGYDAVLTREPGGTFISEKIRKIILDTAHTEMDDITEALLYAASRAQHVAELILPSLNSGKTVICDRFVDSSIVYQGYGRKLGDSVRIINDIAIRGCKPDATFLLKVDPRVLLQRRAEGELDRLELEAMSYHQAVYQGYIELEKQNKERIIGIDATRSAEEISRDICSRIDALIEVKSNENLEQQLR